MRMIALALCVVAAIVVVGCGRPAGNTRSDVAPSVDAGAKSRIRADISVYVDGAASAAYKAVKAVFLEQNPDTNVTETDDPHDADAVLTVDELPDIAKGLKPTTWAYTPLALIVAKRNPCGISDIKDLAGGTVKTIAVFPEDSVLGKHSRDALEIGGILEAAAPKFVEVDSYADMVSTIATGKADVGITYYGATKSMSKGGGRQKKAAKNVQLLGAVPAELSGRIPVFGRSVTECIGGVIFVEFLTSEDAQRLLRPAGLQRATKPSSGEEIALYLYCGAGIQPFMDRAIAAYRQKYPSITIEVGYAGSGCLLSQLTFARRGDLYMPGEDFYISQAHERGFIDTSKLVGYFEPVLLVQKGNPKNIHTLDDILAPGIKLGVGEPDSAAVGRAAVQVFKRAGITDGAEANTVFTGGSVPELGNQVKLKSLDVAVVWNLTAAQLTDSCDSIAIPGEYYDPSPIPVGVLKFSEHPEQAAAFVDFCAGPEGQKLANETGMTPAHGEPSE